MTHGGKRPGAGRPPVGDDPQEARVVLAREHREILDAIQAEHECDRSAAIRWAIERAGKRRKTA